MSLEQPRTPKHLQTLNALSVPAFVALLLGACRPSAILWRVWAVVVDAVQRVIQGRAPSHVRQEALVACPLVAYGDASAAVILVAGKPWVCATPDHAAPRLKLWRPSASARLAVGGEHGGDNLALITAATDSPSALQERSHHDALGSTVAPAAPKGPRAVALRASNHGQSSEAVTCGERNCTRHNRLYQRMANVAQ